MLCERHGSGIEPAVDNLRYTVHLFTAFRALNGHCVDVRAVKLNVIRAVVGFFFQFFDTADAVLMATFTLPYRKRSSPVTVSGKSPVLNILQPVAEASFSDALRNPVDGVVVADQILFYCSHADEPGLTCVVDQRSIASPAVRVAVLEQRCIKQKILVLECLQNRHICFLAEGARPRSFLGHFTFFVYELYERKIVSVADFGVVLTKCRGDMNNTGTIGQCYVGIADYIVCFFVSDSLLSVREQRLVLFELEIFALIMLQNLGAFSKNGIYQSGCHIIGISFACYFYVILIRVDAECNVGRKGPRCGGPCQDVCVLAFYFKADNGRTFFDIFVSLCYFVGRKRGTAARAVRNDFVSFVQKTFLPDLF